MHREITQTDGDFWRFESIIYKKLSRPITCSMLMGMTPASGKIARRLFDVKKEANIKKWYLNRTRRDSQIDNLITTLGSDFHFRGGFTSLFFFFRFFSPELMFDAAVVWHARKTFSLGRKTMDSKLMGKTVFSRSGLIDFVIHRCVYLMREGKFNDLKYNFVFENIYNLYYNNNNDFIRYDFFLIWDKIIYRSWSAYQETR